MLNITLWWLLAIPLVLSVLNFVILPKLNPNYTTGQVAIFSVGGLLIATIIMSTAFYLGKGSKTGDTELWNGQITSKERIHDSYVHSYQCNCTTSRDSNGNSTTSCQTCYEDHYTVEWKAHSNVGSFRIDKKDETSKRVYNTPDPNFYTNVKIGEPCSTMHGYTNYIKAVPESLFRPAAAEVKARFQNMIPTYPNAIYGEWRVDRVVPVKLAVPNLHEWNNNLSLALREMGPSKQANAIIVLANTNDPTYAYALQDAWLGGKKNDIIVIVGTSDLNKKPDWVHVLALTDNELFKIQLRDEILGLEQLTSTNVVDILKKQTLAQFKRKSMKDFAYLDAEIDPPTWVNVTTSIVILLSYLGFWFWNSQQLQFTRSHRAGYNSYRTRKF